MDFKHSMKERMVMKIGYNKLLQLIKVNIDIKNYII